VGVVPGRDPAPIARFGNAGVGTILGPGTFSWNAGASKRYAIAERLALKLEGTFTNVTNHVNLAIRSSISPTAALGGSLRPAASISAVAYGPGIAASGVLVYVAS